MPRINVKITARIVIARMPYMKACREMKFAASRKPKKSVPPKSSIRPSPTNGYLNASGTALKKLIVLGTCASTDTRAHSLPQTLQNFKPPLEDPRVFTHKSQKFRWHRGQRYSPGF